MKINGKTSIYGLVGNPVEHTMSPVIHNTLAEKLGINMAYVPFLVEKNLQKAIEGAYALNIQGMNVTVPYKSDVLEHIVCIDELAKNIGAVNTLVRVEGGYKGYNTDMTGLYRAMCSYGIKVQGEEVIILGAGGAARAVAYLCVYHNAKRVYILNRTIEKAENIAQEIRECMNKDIVVPMKLQDYSQLGDRKMLCIQATSVGLSPKEDEVVIKEEAFYQKIHTGYDLIYRPTNTKFMQLVKAQGGMAYHGLKMLLYQGIEAFELWNQVKVENSVCEEIYNVMKDEMGIEE